MLLKNRKHLSLYFKPISVTNDQLTQFLLQQLLDEAGEGQVKLEDRKAVEDSIFSKDGPNVAFPQVLKNTFFLIR